VREVSEGDRSWLAEQALDALPHALFVVDSLRRGRPNVLVNAAYSALTGYDVREAVARDFDALAIFVEAAEVAALDAGHGAVSASKEIRVRRRDGTLFPATLELRSVHRGDARYLVGRIGKLDSGERTTNRTPAARADAAETAAPMPGKEAFFSWLSHELRSPLNACVMWLDVLALSPQPDKLTKAVDAIKRNLARQARLVSEISDAAKVASGGLALHFEALDVVALVKLQIDTWQSLAESKRIDFQPRLEADAAPLAGDTARLTQALNYLVENAIASTPQGGRIEVRVRAPGGQCVVEVADTGVALTPDDIANLGIPLWRAPTAPRARSGLGLGLAVAHHIAAEHGGSLTAASAAAGAEFSMTLPLANGDPGSVAQTNRNPSP
jgi:signal transduction histidine kinase